MEARYFIYPSLKCALAVQSENEKLKVLVAQLCPTLDDPMDYSPLGFSVHGILQAGILEWVAYPFSRASSNPGIKPGPPVLQADSLLFEPPGKPCSHPFIR